MATAQSSSRIPWNHGRIVGPKPPLEPTHIWAIRTRLQHDGHIRDLAMFSVAISPSSACATSTLVPPSAARDRRPSENRASRAVFRLTDPARETLTAWRKKRGLRPADWLFPSRSHPGDHITTRQFDDWVALASLDPAAHGTRGLLRTKVALVYERSGNLRACQLLFGHTKLESTVRYLGIEVDDALVLSEQTDP